MTQQLRRRTGRRGFGTDFQFLHNLRLTQVTIPINSSGASGVTRFSPWDELGLQNLTPTDTAQVCDSIFGPRDQVADDARLTVDRWGAPTKIVDAMGAVTKIIRGDPNFPLLVTRVTYPRASGSGDGRVVLMTYDQTRGNLTQVRDSTWHLATSIRVPTKSTMYQYCVGVACNTEDSPTRVTDSVGTQVRTTTYTYTTLGLTNDVVDSRGHRTVYGYTTGATVGLVNQITEKTVETWLDTLPALADGGSLNLDLVQKFTFDSKGNLQTATSAGQVVTGYQTDGAGRVTDTYTPLGFRQHYDYDPMNRITKVTRFTAKTISPVQPSPVPVCRASFHFCGDSTRAVGAALGTSVAVQYNFGAADLNSIVDGRNVTRSFVYDARGLITEEHSGFQGRVVRYITYDEAGNVALRINPIDTIIRNNQTIPIVDTTSYFYDAANRLQKIGYHEKDYGIANGIPQLVPGDTIRYTYDQLGVELTASNLNGTMTRTYWADGALQSRKTTSPVFDSLFYAYDQARARTTMSHTSGTSTDVVTYTYGPTSGDLQTMSVNWGAPANLTRSASFLWDGLGRRKQVTYPNGTLVKYRYGGDSQLRRLVSTNPTAIPGVGDRFDFTYRADSLDTEGRPLHQRTSCTGYMTPDAGLGYACGAGTLLNQANRYNRFNQLVWQKAGIPDSFAFDASDNMIMQKTGSQLPHWFNISINSNRILADSVDGAATGSVVHFFYDSTGSRFEEGTATSILRLYYYDGMGRTSGIRDTEHNGNTRFKCLGYNADGDLLWPCDEGGNKLAYDGSNVVGATSVRYWSFVHGPGLDDPILGLYRQTQPSVFKEWYWVTDGNGRQFATAAADGTLGSIPSNEYTDNGGSYAGGTQNANTFKADRFASPVLPALSFFRNRVYDQNTGRWSQEDPTGAAGGLNLYAFNGNNPVMFTDPFGLKTCPPDCGLIHAVSGVAFGTVSALAAGAVTSPSGPGAVVSAGVAGAAGFTAGVAAANLAEDVAEATGDAVERGMTKLEKAFVTIMSAFSFTTGGPKIRPPEEKKIPPPVVPRQQPSGEGPPKPNLPFELRFPE